MPRCVADGTSALAALERIKARHQCFLDAAARVTKLANNAVKRFATGKAIREALGEAYLGGPLL